MKSFRKTLETYRSLYLDTNILIYHLEDHRPYSDLSEIIFELIESGKARGHTSVLSILEINVAPYQAGQPDRALSHIALLKNLPHFLIHPVTIEISDRAAELRAKYRIKTPDAIHVATAVECGSDCIIGNDKDLLKIKDLSIHYLDDYVS